jgi:prolyl oligopeptidase
MSQLMTSPPHSNIEAVTEILHGIPVTDPYRWLEDQNSSRTRAWIADQTRYCRAYLDAITNRGHIRERIRRFLAVETFDLLQPVANRYFFRKRLPDQEQPCIYMRECPDGEDHLLVDPAERDTGTFTAVKPLRVSPDGRLLLYEIKEGGERTGTFALLDIASRTTLPDVLPRGYLRGLVFAPDGKSFYYVLEALDTKRPLYRAAHHHVLGSQFSEDREVFFAGEDQHLRLYLTSDATHMTFAVVRFHEKTSTQFYRRSFESHDVPELISSDFDLDLHRLPIPERTIAITYRDAPNGRIVEEQFLESGERRWIDVIPETNMSIKNVVVLQRHFVVLYMKDMVSRLLLFDFSGRQTGELPVRNSDSVNVIGGSAETEEFFIETESFTEPVSIFRCSAASNQKMQWAKQTVPIDSANYCHVQFWYPSKDGTHIPMYLVGRRDVVENGAHPTVMTSYGGYGISAKPRFSPFVLFLIEHGCLFALPNIRGGGEFGPAWHEAAKRRNRQTAYDDFLSGAEWLIKSRRTTPERLAIFGGSNSGLLVAAALTQRPDLFRAVICMVPLLDMLRYHLFDQGYVWREEFGTSEDPDDFAALASYSPYHRVENGVAYPATMIVSGDADRNCNPLHARKMTARLQTANVSSRPIILDYSAFRGHSPVLPLSVRVEALTDRLAFLCDQLQVSV